MQKMGEWTKVSIDAALDLVPAGLRLLQVFERVGHHRALVECTCISFRTDLVLKTIDITQDPYLRNATVRNGEEGGGGPANLMTGSLDSKEVTMMDSPVCHSRGCLASIFGNYNFINFYQIPRQCSMRALHVSNDCLVAPFWSSAECASKLDVHGHNFFDYIDVPFIPSLVVITLNQLLCQRHDVA
jgi:hypothetical protein